MEELISMKYSMNLEAALEAEVESHIANEVLAGKNNRQSGSNKKTIKGTSEGPFEPKPQEIVTVSLNLRS